MRSGDKPVISSATISTDHRQCQSTANRLHRKVECTAARYRVSWDWMGVNETLLDEIVRRVLEVACPDRIILFGSAATGQMTKDSDIDLLVVEPAPANTRERSVEIRDAVGDIGFPVDVIVMRTERFERTKRVIGGIAYPANKYGRVIYAAAA
jgi:predicted nucleotidyltransferase